MVKTLRISQKKTVGVLKMTAGGWSGDDWPKTTKDRRKIELLATKKRKMGILDYEGFLGSGGETGTDLENRIRRNKKEKEYIKKLRSKK